MLSFMKALSLLLLFLYAATGARLALAGREEQFFPTLLMLMEIVVYVLAAAYLAPPHSHFWQPEFLGRSYGCSRRAAAVLGSLDSPGKVRFPAHAVRFDAQRRHVVLQPGAGGNSGGAGRVLPGLRGVAAIPSDGSGRHSVLVRGGAGYYGHAFRISRRHAGAAGKFVPALNTAL